MKINRFDLDLHPGLTSGRISIMGQVAQKDITLDEADIVLLSSVLWDTDLRKLKLQKDKHPIIERALMYGREEHVRWVYDHYSEKDIEDIVRSSLNLDERTANYWAIRLHIPKREIICFSKPAALI